MVNVDVHSILSIVTAAVSLGTAYMALSIKLAVAELKAEIAKDQAKHADELRCWAEAHFAVK